MKQYQELLSAVLQNGTNTQDNEGKPIKAAFGLQARFNMADGFPLVTVKPMNFRTVVAELVWTLSGDTNVKKLNEMGVTAWNHLADAKGDLGTTTGSLWRAATGLWKTSKHVDTLNKAAIDQIADVKAKISSGNGDTMLIVSAWDPNEINRMPQPSQVPLLQFYVQGDNLSLMVHQRSGDLGVGVPYSIAENALLLHMMAHVTGKRAHELIMNFGYLYIREGHMKAASEMIKADAPALPTVELSAEVDALTDFTPDKVSLKNYNPIVKAKAEPELAGVAG